MERILMVRGKSQYDSTRIFFNEIKREWERLGLEIDLLDSYDETAYIQIRKKLQSRSYDAVVTINGMLLEKESDLRKMILKDGIIYATMLMDHPLIHHERLRTSYPYCLVLSPDKKHVDYLRRYYPNIWKTGFLAHGGCQAQKRVVPYGERTFDLSFMGSYNRPEEIWQEIEGYPEQMKILMENCVYYLLHHTEKTLEEAMEKVFYQFGIEIPWEEFAPIASEFRAVDRYVRCYYRDKVLRILLENEIEVHVFGDGWERMELSGSSRLQIHGRVGYQESLEIVADSKISLNVMPWFKEGSHDRVFSAMLNGAVCLTDSSEYLKEECKEGTNLLCYSLDNLEQLPFLVRSVLDDVERGRSIAEAGKKLAEQKHTWAVRGREFLEYLLEAEKERG
ncbi:MAG: glycosyltransferase family 1 protein [Lachnospiraceae bacterium]|nr:glycosyltransferase family 1 protein [Lachnospiraceae bacterium]